MASIVYLDAGDEITSAAARIRSSHENRVALVVPNGSRLATSRINFRLLAREAQSRGRQLSVVAGDAATRALAASAGLPAFSSVREYEEAEAAPGVSQPGSADPASEPTRPRKAPPKPAAAAVAAAAARASSPHEDLEATALIPTAAPQPRSAAVAASARPVAARAAEPDPRPAASIPVVGSRRAVRLPFGRHVGIALVGVLALAVLASGVGAYLLLPSAEITITTRTEAIGPVPLEIRADPAVTTADPATATVPARRLTFEVAVSDTFPTTVTVPAGTFVIPQVVPGEASVGVEAVRAGPDGNVPANSITVVPPGENPTFLRVRNPQATSGGERQEFPRVDQADIDAALEQLRARLDEAFTTILGDPARIPPDLTLFPETRRLEEPVPTTDSAALLNQEVPEFTLGLASTGSVIAVDEAPIEVIARSRIDGEVAEGYRLVEDSIEIVPGDPVVDGETVTFPVSASAQQIRLLDADRLREEIKGKPIAQARTLLERYGAVRLNVWPEWVTAIPTIDARLTLRIEAPPAAGSGPSPSPRPGASPAPASPAGRSPGPSGTAVPGPGTQAPGP
jgi:hypothetical protein